jgi:hypothetical protein
MHLVVYFCGTGDPGNDFPEQYDYVNPQYVKNLFVKGCDEPEVCNSGLFPDLKSFANRFVKTLFGINVLQILGIPQKDGKILESIGINLSRSSQLEFLQKNLIESITLCGFSRGAVTCFEVARVLKKIAPQIPVDIVADQPVPGNCYQGPGTNAGSIADCSDLTNIKNVSIILAAYTGVITEFDIHVKKKLPESKDGELNQYKNSYIYVKQGNEAGLYYVNQECKTEKVEHDPDGLSKTFKQFDIDPKVEQKHTLNGDYLNWFTQHYKPEAMRENTSTLYSLVHRGFFSQIVPKLPRTTRKEHIIIPRENHHQVRPNAPQGQKHLHLKVAEFLKRKNQDNIKLVKDDALERKREEARATYTVRVDIPPAPFPQVSQLQSFFGLDKKDAYRYIDKLHPTAYLRKGMMLAEDQTLIDWWQKQDKNASYLSTQLTKDLVEIIKKTKTDDVEKLKKLYVQADKWLIVKENSSSSRYYQVESLRNNIYHLLINTFNVSKGDLSVINRQTLHETDYFLRSWTERSAAASSFKTDITRQLDIEFAKHARVSPPNKQADEDLLKHLDSWLDVKKDSRSSRYDLVVEMRERLQDIIAKAYREDREDREDLEKNSILL